MAYVYLFSMIVLYIIERGYDYFSIDPPVTRIEDVSVDDFQYLLNFNLTSYFVACKVLLVLFCLSICLSVCLTDCQSACLSDCQSVCLSDCQSVCLSVCLSVYCLSFCLLVCLSVCLSVCLFV